MFARVFILYLLVLEFDVNAIKLKPIEKLSTTGFVDGDFIIGAIFPVHGYLLSNLNENDPLRCDRIRSSEGIQLVEAAFFAIDSINKNEHLLPGIKLGIVIKDECWSEQVALYQTIKLLEDSKGPESYLLPKEKGKRKSEFIGMIGATTGSGTNQIQSLLKLYKIPQVSYSAFLLDLQFPNYFVSVVPNHFHEALLVLSLIRKFAWNYISIAYTDGYYGGNEKYLLQEMSSSLNVCIAANVRMSKANQETMYMQTVFELFQDERSRVILCFCNGPTVTKLYQEIRNRNLTGRYQILVSSSWYINEEDFQGYEKEAHGTIFIERKKTILPGFDNYFLDLNLQNNNRNPWFEEFWEFQFGCHVNDADSNLPACTGHEDLKRNYEQKAAVSYVIKSINTFAYGLDKMRTDLCKGAAGACAELYPFNTTLYMDYLLNLEFNFYDDYVNFAFTRSPKIGKYDIFNYQQLKDGSYSKIKVSEYNFNFEFLHSTMSFQFEYFNEIQFPGHAEQPIKSTCSDPCSEIQIKVRGSSDKSCCWTCVHCQPHEIIKDEYTCMSCPQGYWPNNNHNKCIRIPIIYSHWKIWQILLAKTLSLLGMIVTVITSFIFVKYRDTPVVKSSTRELCYLMLIGIFMLHCISFITSAKPTPMSCILIESMPPISSAVIYVSLLVKTNRIARLLAISKKKFPNPHPKFMSLKAQLIITMILILVLVIPCIILIANRPPKVTENYEIDEYGEFYMNIECEFSGNTLRFCFAYKAILVILGTYYAIKTRKIPDNFNEAKYLGCLMYILTITFFAYTLVHFGSNLQMLATGLCASVCAFAVLIVLFFPKLYIILFMPQKNTREHFATATGIRYLFGGTNLHLNQQSTNK